MRHGPTCGHVGGELSGFHPAEAVHRRKLRSRQVQDKHFFQNPGEILGPVTIRVTAHSQTGGQTLGERFAGVYDGKRLVAARRQYRTSPDREYRNMPRLNNLNDLLFPVEEHPVFVEIQEPFGKRQIPVPDKMVIVHGKSLITKIAETVYTLVGRSETPKKRAIWGLQR